MRVDQIRHRFYAAVGKLIRESRLGSTVSHSFGAVHKLVYRTTRGHAWNRIGRGQILILTTTGCRSGVKRSHPLTTVPLDNGCYAVIGSNAGGPRDPGWANNLRAEPKAHIQVLDREFAVQARLVTESSEWNDIFRHFVDIHDHYTEYTTHTSRKLPIFILEP